MEDTSYVADTDKIMLRASGIVERYRLNGNKLPRSVTSKARANDSQKEQEYKDAQKLKNWKKYLKNQSGGSKLPDEVKKYLDSEMPGWSYQRMPEDSQDTLAKAKAIVNRYRARGFVLPKEDMSGEDHSQNIKDIEQMRLWVRMQDMNRATGAAIVAMEHLDDFLPGWRTCFSDSSSSINAANNAPSSNKREEAEAIFHAILLHKKGADEGTEGATDSGGEEEGIDKKTFCEWFVRFRGEASRRMQASKVDRGSDDAVYSTFLDTYLSDTDTSAPSPAVDQSDYGVTLPAPTSTTTSASSSGTTKRKGETKGQTEGRKRGRR